MKNLLVVLSFIFCATVQAQVTFQRLYKVNNSVVTLVKDVQQADDSGVVVLGDFFSNLQMGQVLILKTTRSGNIQWMKSYDSISDYALAKTVINCIDGGYAFGGSATKFDSSGNVSFAFLIRIDDTGKILFEKKYNSTGLSSVIQTSDKGFMLLSSSQVSNYLNAIYLIKTDSFGNTMWTKAYADTITKPLAHFIRQTKDNGYIISGEAATGALPNDMWLAKTDSGGNFLWSKAYGGSYPEKLFSFTLTEEGNYVLGGYSQSFGANHNQRDGYLIETNDTGQVLWAKTYGYPIVTQIQSIHSTITGNIIVAGNTHNLIFNSDMALMKLDNNGNVFWTKLIGDPVHLEVAYFVDEAKDNNGYILAGRQESTGAFIPNIYVVKSDSSGNEGGCSSVDTIPIVQNVPTVITNVILTPFSTIDSYATLTSSVTTYQGMDSVLCFTTAISSPLSIQPNISIFPNPTTGIVTIKAPSSIEAIKISNAFGENVFSSQPQSPNATINLQSLPAGIYFYSVKTKHKTERGKIVLQ